MAITSEIPVTVSADAEERIRELNLQRECEAMLEHTKQTVPGLRAIEVSLFFFEDSSEPLLLITASRDSPVPEECDLVRGQWDTWLVRTFGPEVVEWFIFDIDYDTYHAR